MDDCGFCQDLVLRSWKRAATLWKHKSEDGYVSWSDEKKMKKEKGRKDNQKFYQKKIDQQTTNK